MAPDVEKHVAQEVFGQGLVAYEAQQPALQRNSMAHKKGLHGELIAACDPPDQHFVGGSFAAATCAGDAAHPIRVETIFMGQFPFNHVPLNKLVRTGKIPTPVRDQLTVRRGSTR